MSMNHAVAGMRLGVAQAGIKMADHDDVVLISLAPGSSTSAVFTQNAFRAAPVLIAAEPVMPMRVLGSPVKAWRFSRAKQWQI